ncbi:MULTISPECIES: histidine phosphatase family protein [Thalassobaculum]|uniref:Phosphohistidine phosphatase SixA n=1 Tax=Thalassobaculum litoreum DSM 18839 TaxID=1123362 RepID=A0A8G2BIQ0_9PROT|nr:MULTISPECIES: histidine phosphatase family protein [Thalassobaculum]SDF93655.1 Phosphohistidine phosphatase SixA [Thalassobaculum litoreum DSM 18839]
MTRSATALLTICFLAALALPTVARAGAEGWEAMRRPGAIALMRHAYAPGTGDPDNFTLGDCSTQRTLNDEGRAQARRIGEAFRRNGIEVDAVLTSQWCRSAETAELLGLGTPEPMPSLNSFFDARQRRAEQTEATLAFLRSRPEDHRLVLVTHQVNITALTGRGTASGEFVVIDLTPTGEVEVLGEVLVGR